MCGRCQLRENEDSEEASSLNATRFLLLPPPLPHFTNPQQAVRPHPELFTMIFARKSNRLLVKKLPLRRSFVVVSSGRLPFRRPSVPPLTPLPTLYTPTLNTLVRIWLHTHCFLPLAPCREEGRIEPLLANLWWQRSKIRNEQFPALPGLGFGQ